MSVDESVIWGSGARVHILPISAHLGFGCIPFGNCCFSHVHGPVLRHLGSKLCGAESWELIPGHYHLLFRCAGASPARIPSLFCQASSYRISLYAGEWFRHVCLVTVTST